MENFNYSKEINSVDLFNNYKFIEGVVSFEGGKIILNDNAKKEGWIVGLSFNEFVKTLTVSEGVKGEADRLKTLNYEVRVAKLSSEPFNHTYCLVYRDILKEENKENL